jgi:hypothetical protein
MILSVRTNLPLTERSPGNTGGMVLRDEVGSRLDQEATILVFY